jgi:hypothetical protein
VDLALPDDREWRTVFAKHLVQVAAFLAISMAVLILYLLADLC